MPAATDPRFFDPYGETTEIASASSSAFDTVTAWTTLPATQRATTVPDTASCGAGEPTVTATGAASDPVRTSNPSNEAESDTAASRSGTVASAM